jgi:Mg-chelatase subunit ChlD
MPAKRDKKMDIVFVLDATGSMANTIAAARDKVADLAFDLHVHNRTGDFRYASICYRDPVDAKADKHEVFDLTDNAENLSEWLETIKATGGGDGPEDFVGALELAFRSISWREGSKRALIWIADAPAHGKRYCGFDNHQEEEPKLEPLVARLGNEKYYIVGMSLNGGANVSFAAMKAIYESHGGPSFVIESFKPDPGNEVGRIAETMMATTTSTVKAALLMP